MLMNRMRTGAGIAILLTIALVIGYSAWRVGRPDSVEYCQFSARPVHSQTKTVALVEGKSEVFCCLACAFTLQSQTGKAVKILELADYETGTPLLPEDSYVVKESRVNMCVRQHMLLDETKQATPMDFDRCAPSLVAFARKEAAETFVREQGGTIVPFRELVPVSH